MITRLLEEKKNYQKKPINLNALDRIDTLVNELKENPKLLEHYRV